MKRFRFLKSMTLLAILFVGISSCTDDDDNIDSVEAPLKNIIETAQDTEMLSSLVEALTKADENSNSELISTLSGNGPFTVFAPTNEAFSELFDSLEGYDSLEDFESEEERALLISILTYHVVSGTAALSTDLTDGQQITTVQGEDIGISIEGDVFVQDATGEEAVVTQADIVVSNGVVHVIDKVLIPEAVLTALITQTITETVIDTETLSILEIAVIQANVAEILNSDAEFTVFAPTDDAFAALLVALGDDFNSLEDFDDEEEIELLRNILLYHVIPGTTIKAADLEENSLLTAFPENSIDIIASGDTFVIGDASTINANITATDIKASNGIAHTIDKVLLPQAALDFIAARSL